MDEATERDGDPLLPTRASLLSRLRDWQDQAGWSEFFDAYWRLVYNVARKGGLGDAEAQDVVQSTFIYLARRMPNFRYDRTRGSFKSWLCAVTRSRLHAHWRAEKAGGRFGRRHLDEESAEDLECAVVRDAGADEFAGMWQREWETNLLDTAFRRLRSKVSSRQLLIFRLATLGELTLSQVAKKLGVSLAQVYLARHRVGRLFRNEVQRLRLETE